MIQEGVRVMPEWEFVCDKRGTMSGSPEKWNGEEPPKGIALLLLEPHIIHDFRNSFLLVERPAHITDIICPPAVLRRRIRNSAN